MLLGFTIGLGVAFLVLAVQNYRKSRENRALQNLAHEIYGENVALRNGEAFPDVGPNSWPIRRVVVTTLEDSGEISEDVLSS